MGDFDKKIKSLLNEHQNQIDEKKAEKERQEEEIRARNAKIRKITAGLYNDIKPQIESLYSQLYSKNIKAISRLEISGQIFHLDFNYKNANYSIEEVHLFCPRYCGPPHHEIERGFYFANSSVTTSERGTPFLHDYEPEQPSSKNENREFESPEDFLEYIFVVVERLLSKDVRDNY